MGRALWIGVLVVVATALAGCTGGDAGSPVPRELNVVVENSGDTAIGTDLSVEAPNGTVLLDESFQAGPGTREFSVTMRVDDRHDAYVRYRGSSGSQSIDSDRRHLIGPSDCDEGPITLRFLIDWTTGGSSNQWNNKGSVGECPSPAEDG